jgi:hypothetical protein
MGGRSSPFRAAIVYWHTVPGAWNISRVICFVWLMPFTV